MTTDEKLDEYAEFTKAGGFIPVNLKTTATLVNAVGELIAEIMRLRYENNTNTSK